MRKILFILLSATLFFSCTSPKQLNYLQDKGPHYSMHPFEDYKLQYNDEIYCSILTADSEFAGEFNRVLTQTGEGAATSGGQNAYTVYENGYISIPFFGDIKVIGLTIPEVEDVILRKMKESIPDAQVRVALRNNMFYIVAQDGSRTANLYKDNITIFQAMAISGDMSNNVSIDMGKVKIVRLGDDGNSIVKTFDLRSESVIESEFYYIKPNDVLYYSTSKGSFFRITSLSSFFATVMAPITFLLMALTVKF